MEDNMHSDSMMTIHKPAQSLLKVYLKSQIGKRDMNTFREELSYLLDRIDETESEEFNKNLVSNFLNASLYRDKGYMVNTYGSADLAIYANSDTSRQRPVVLFEFKGPSRPDMVSVDNLKKKALYELILYYIREEVGNGNTGIKHLIITNCYEYFIFEKRVFYKLFARNQKFAKRVLDADNSKESTDYIYSQIIAPAVEQLEHRLEFTYLDLRSLRKSLKGKEHDSRNISVAYKLLSPIHLLKLPFSNDHNKLNSNFYHELLYIMGVEDVVEDGKHVIKRQKKNKQPYSLVEQAYDKLEDYPAIVSKEQRFDEALGLVLIWINRILFLKLLESQLRGFGLADDVRFLDIKHIPDYDVLNDLFFRVLARPEQDRPEDMLRQFPNVPYLNSSLFEVSKNEINYFLIGVVRMGEIDVYGKTVLKNERGRRLTGKKNALDYLFSFLDAYDFGESQGASEDSEVRDDSKTLISASVLGLIFEKINGYKDGSFFTPGFITQLMCRDTLRRAVVDKFNEAKGWTCADFDELKEQIDYKSREVRMEGNQIVNSLRICDPAVGSGHFLVSALNELIAIKSELGILQDRQEKPKRLKDYDILVENDELVASDEDGEVFAYNPSSQSSQTVQETLFEEKRTIIENCLFGVDLNPKSVEICRLRLWIELLKNAYYYTDEKGKRRLQTLPNIDINIKCGNSLYSNFPVTLGAKLPTNSDIRKQIEGYKRNVRSYKACRNKSQKQELNNRIAELKRRLLPSAQLELFEDDNSKNKRREERRIKEQALEWMIEFPEILSDDGKLLGFDVIIGNPPYISLQKLKADGKAYEAMRRRDEKGNLKQRVYSTFDKRGDIYSLFIERGLHLLREGGRLTYILPNKWEKVGYGESVRQLFLDTNLEELIDFGDEQIFDDATTYTCIIRMSKQPSEGTLQYALISKVDVDNLPIQIEQTWESFDKARLNNGIWTISSPAFFNDVKRMQEQMGTLGDYVGGEGYRGILTGMSEAFSISLEQYNELIGSDPHSADLLRPFMQGKGQRAYGQVEVSKYLVFMPKGFTAERMVVDKDKEKMPEEKTAWSWLEEKYPAIANHLMPYAVKGRERIDKGDYWWELRACAYYDRFSMPKLFYQAFQTRSCFVYDDTGVLCNNSMFFLSVPDKSLLALLCSDLGWRLIREFCPRIQGGCQLIWENFSHIPVPSVLPDTLSELAERMMQLTAEGADTSDTESEINEIVNNLYGMH